VSTAVDLLSDFQLATQRVQTLPSQPREIQLELNGLYRQATLGDVSGSRPPVFEVEGRARFDAWSRRRGLSRTDAMRTYVDLVGKLVER
jgi:acyl-CoA-binding protein